MLLEERGGAVQLRRCRCVLPAPRADRNQPLEATTIRHRAAFFLHPGDVGLVACLDLVDAPQPQHRSGVTGLTIRTEQDEALELMAEITGAARGAVAG